MRGDDSGQMKKQPSDATRAQAKTLRREMTEAERKIWHRLHMRQVEVTDFAVKCCRAGCYR